MRKKKKKKEKKKKKKKDKNLNFGNSRGLVGSKGIEIKTTTTHSDERRREEEIPTTAHTEMRARQRGIMACQIQIMGLIFIFLLQKPCLFVFSCLLNPTCPKFVWIHTLHQKTNFFFFLFVKRQEGTNQDASTSWC